MDYKEVIIKKRIRLGYSRNKLSQLIGISQPFIIEIEEGEKSHRWIAFGGSGRKISGFSGRRPLWQYHGGFAGSPFAFYQRRGLRLLPRACAPHGTNKKDFRFFCSAACARRGLCEGGTFAGFPFAFHQCRGFRLLPRACAPHGTNKKRACWLFLYWCG